MCPSCAAPHESSERFCRDCGLPLVLGDGHEEEPLSEARERARKVLPRYSQGPLVRVATARHQAEAEMLEGMLLEEGIPSLARRSGGFDVPDFLASGPRDILVPSSGEEAAREMLGDPRGPRRIPPEPHAPWIRALAVTLAVLALAMFAAGIVVPFFD